MTEQEKLPNWLYVGAAVRWKCASPQAVYVVLDTERQPIWPIWTEKESPGAKIVRRDRVDGPDLAHPIYVRLSEISPLSLVEAAGLLAGEES